jgi:hypothetical protein
MGLVSIMYANNEVGTIQPLDECARIAHGRRAGNEDRRNSEKGGVAADDGFGYPFERC